MLLKQFTLLCFILIIAGCGNFNVKTSLAQSQTSYSDSIVQAIDISTDGRYTILSDQKGVCVWDNKTNQKLYACIPLDSSKPREMLGIADNNAVFFTSNRIQVDLYNLKTGQQLGSWSTGHNIIGDLTISADGKLIALGYKTGSASIIDIDKNKVNTFKIHRLDINSIALTKAENIVISGSSDKFVKVWRTDTGEVLQSVKLPTRVNHVDISPDGKLGLAIDALGERMLFNSENGEELASLQINARFLEINDSVFSKDNKWLLTGSPNRKARLWQVSDGQLMAEWETYKKAGRDRASVLAVSFFAGNKAITNTSDGMQQVWPIPKFD
ncbi:hypothetical protein J8L70_01820 [Pseudoalteromonas sp. MMG010]|uniref:WD40 repeat domain-containing protein n=1 Tax=Pseudoalteromonas sp. MMG010 TaxID=2822685 RepID=UPI001B39E7DF|nr:hypothetical protein [Pseudoalteromonas sp. MMG010]MBQ4831969.1 hypothetical protein [Pseudoalteromonas sp. MMG010]